MHSLRGTIKHYDWGSTAAIAAILGIPETGEPIAEYWIGAHPSGPATISDATLDRYVTTHPETLGVKSRAEFGDRLAYMTKLLSAARPLSLQAHPNRSEAAEGFERENGDDIDINAAHRTFKDPWDKPELIIALTPFDALAGFRDPAATLDLFAELGVDVMPLMSPLRDRDAASGLAQVFLDCLILDTEHSDILTDVVVAAVNHVEDEGELGSFARTAVTLDEHFPGDPSLLAALLLKRFHLEPGESLHIRPGVMHAYLHGTGVEVLGSSDNVLRGGLTRKHIDPAKLVEVVRFEPESVAPLLPIHEGAGVWFYDAGEKAFAEWRLDLHPGATADVPARDSGRTVLVTRGNATLTSGSGNLQLGSGDAAFLDAGETVRISGNGAVFVTACGVDA